MGTRGTGSAAPVSFSRWFARHRTSDPGPTRANIRGGTVHGASDAHAAYVKNNPAHVRDVCATICHCLGIDPEMPVYDHGRRPIPIAHGGRPLEDILA
jgi:hypothetical protein